PRDRSKSESTSRRNGASEVSQIRACDEPIHPVASSWPRMISRPGKSIFELGLLLGRCEIGDEGARALLESEMISADVPELFLGPSPASAGSIVALKAKYKRATVRF